MDRSRLILVELYSRRDIWVVVGSQGLEGRATKEGEERGQKVGEGTEGRRETEKDSLGKVHTLELEMLPRSEISF